MGGRQSGTAMLTDYRVLDLTDEKGFLCGKILGDLGADVVKVEKPAGDPARRIGPFVNDIPDPEKSLHWFALNSSKRGITLNLESREGQDIFRRLSDRADMVIESFTPGYMDELGLGYSALSARNPRLIMTSITHFGQGGPYRDRKASDIVLMAMSGLMRITGDSDRPPLRLCFDQSYYLASAHAAVGTLLALRHRHFSGEGQQVDVSMYECAVRANYREPVQWEFDKKTTLRMGISFSRGGASRRQFWRSKDGYVTWMLMTENAKPVRAFIEWIQEEGRADLLKGLSWDEASLFKLTAREIGALENAIGQFIRTHTTKELDAASIERGLLLSPVNEVDEVVRDEHLMARRYWKEIEQPESGKVLTHPRFTFLTSEGGNEVRCRAPRIGEHNTQVYEGELGFSKEELSALRVRGIM